MFLRSLTGINKTGTTILFIIIGAIILVPIIFIFFYSIKISYEDLDTVLNPKLLSYTFQTLKLLFYTGLFSLFFSVIPAWVLTNYDIKFKNAFDLLLMLPLAFPCYIMAFTYVDILGYGGPFYTFCQKNLGYTLEYDVLSIEWLSLFLSLSLYPYVYATSRVSFLSVSSIYHDLCKSLGLTGIKKFIKIIAPISFWGIASGILIVFMEVLNEYGAVNYFGVQTFSVGIFKYWFSLNNKKLAIILSFLLIAIVMIFLLLSFFIKKRDSKIKSHIKGRKIKLYNFKNIYTEIICKTIIFLPIIFGFLIPLFFIFRNVIRNFNDYNFNEVVNGFINSISLSLITAFIVVLSSFIILNYNRLHKNKILDVIIKSLTVGYAVPAAVVGLSIMLIIQLIVPDFSFLIGSISLLIYAYVFRYISVAVFPIKNSFSHQPVIYDQLANSLGLSRFKILRKITLPLNIYSLIIAFLFVFIDTMKELPITLILRPFNFETLSTLTYEYAIEEMLSYSALYSLAIILCCAVVITFVRLFLKHK